LSFSTDTPVDTRELHRAAVRRKRARRFAPVSPSLAERRAAFIEGRTLPAIDWNAPEFTAPRDLGEWLDDRLTEVSPWPHGRDPVTAVLFAIVEGAREGGPAAAVAAVRRAKRLDGNAQYRAYSCLVRWRGRRDTVAEPVMNAVIGEWRRLGLAESEPDDDE
jgi:hypothetical protein